MADLDSLAEWLRALYRMLGLTSGDDALTENSESADEVGYTLLNHGVEAAQLFLIGCGMSERWRARSSVITTWSGADSTDGGRYKVLSDVTTNFLRFSGRKYDETQSSLMTANGNRWGVEIDADHDAATGNVYYLKNQQLWLGAGAAPPSDLYLDYQFKHPEITALVTLNFPSNAAGLVIAYAAQLGSYEAWFPGGNEGRDRISNAVVFWEREARKVARRSRGKRTQTAPRVIGTRFMA